MRPSRLIPSDELGGWVVAVSNDGTYGYGHSYTGTTLNDGYLYVVDFDTAIWAQRGAVPDGYSFDSAGGNWCFPLSAGKLYVVLNNGSDQYSLWLSLDDGYTFSKVIDLGDFSFLAGSQATGVSLLKTVAEYDGGVVVAEYNATGDVGAPNFTCILWGGSDPGSLSRLAYWGDAATANTEGDIRHWHTCKVDPYTGKVWLSSGDNGQAGESLDGYQTHLIEWDPAVGTWANNTAGSELAALDGFRVWNAETYGVADDRFRAIELVITSEYVYWACDTSTAGVGGIWRLHKSSGKVSQVWKMPSWMSETHFEGWSGTRLSDGTIIYSISDRGSDESVRRGVQFVASADGDTWHLVGRGTSQVSQFARAQNIRQIEDGRVLISFRRVAGRGTIYQSYLYTVDGFVTETDDDADVLCPVFWVGGANASNSNTGWSPRAPWATLEYALESGVCYGSRIMVQADVTEAGNIAPVGTNAVPVGPANAPIQITGAGRSATTWTFPDALASANLITFPSNANLVNLWIERLTMQVNKTDAIVFFGHSSLASKMQLRDASVEGIAKYVFYLRNLVASQIRSYVEALVGGTNAYAPVFFVGSGATFTAIASIISGGYQNVRYDADGASYFRHSILMDPGANGNLWLRQTIATVPDLSSSILLSDSESINDDVGLTWTGAVRNCYLQAASSPTTIRASDAVRRITAAPVLDANYMATAEEYAEAGEGLVRFDYLRQPFKNPARVGPVEYLPERRRAV